MSDPGRQVEQVDEDVRVAEMAREGLVEPVGPLAAVLAAVADEDSWILHGGVAPVADVAARNPYRRGLAPPTNDHAGPPDPSTV